MINAIGIKTLYKKDVSRFMRVYNQTIIGPIINALIFFTIFTTLAHNNSSQDNHLLLISGLTMMSIINAAYNNGIFLVVMKMTGNIIDFLTMPLTPNEVIFSLVSGSMTRAFMVGSLIYFSLSIYEMDFSCFNLLIIIIYTISASLFCALVGLIGGLLFNNMEESSLIANYFITPLSFLSGTFYSISKLPIVFQKINLFNPFFYMIDGFRYGIFGFHEASLALGLSMINGFNFLLWLFALWILKSGYKIKK